MAKKKYVTVSLMKDFGLSKTGWNKIANEARKVYKDTILNKGLYDTGFLYDTFFIYPKYNGDFDIDAAFYWVYLDEPYKVTNSVKSNTRFKSFVKSVVEGEAKKEIEKEIRKQLKDLFK